MKKEYRMRAEKIKLNAVSICAQCGMRIEAFAYAIPSGNRHAPYVHPECFDRYEREVKG